MVFLYCLPPGRMLFKPRIVATSIDALQSSQFPNPVIYMLPYPSQANPFTHASLSTVSMQAKKCYHPYPYPCPLSICIKFSVRACVPSNHGYRKQTPGTQKSQKAAVRSNANKPAVLIYKKDNVDSLGFYDVAKVNTTKEIICGR